jgi:hypothetical protein
VNSKQTFILLVGLPVSGACTARSLVFTEIEGNGPVTTTGAGGRRPEPPVDASTGADADASVQLDVTAPGPPSEIAPSVDCPRGVPSSGIIGGCEYNVFGPNMPQPGTLSLMKLRVTGPDGVAAYCLRPHCTVQAGQALTATVTIDASSLVSTEFRQDSPTANPWTIQMNLSRAEDGTYPGCAPSEITASQPAPGGAYAPFSRLWECRLFRTDRQGFDLDGCVWCTGWDAN